MLLNSIQADMILEVEPITFSFNQVFYDCVDLLELTAAIFNTTYEIVNVWIFCIIWPILFVLLIARNIYLKRRLRFFKKEFNKKVSV